ncbi:MAG: type IV toxin-antitoxin system AbiEi family antitoxin domain-containing protein [Desulfotomaculaceae bacterium]|nr:type IV toxin-antitoxin system AbiEi family antitoxin domain-containing protein [Desulfotomaculaceae bacterium]
MKEVTYKQIYNIFKKNNGYARTQDITQAGIHNIYLNNLLENGEIERIKRGLYRWVDMENPAGSVLLDVAMAIPNGVICLQYALAYYDLTTYKPWEITVAVGRKSRVTLPEYPPVKLYYFSPKVFNAGIEKIQAGGHEVKIYSKEKTICDCMRYRKQLGKDIIKEMMLQYIKTHTRNLELLMKYAEICGVTKQVQTYIEVLL